MSVLDMLNSSVDELADTAQEWLLFVQDHRSFILQNSDNVTLSNDEMFRYEYRPEEYLKDNKLPLSILWIFLWINQLTNPMQFPTIKTLVVPKPKYLYELRNEYRTFVAQLSK